MSSRINHFYEFGSFRLDSERRRLLRNGDVVNLSPKALEALLVLVRNPGRLLEREELMKAVWAYAFVEDANLTVAISQVRKALGQQTGEEEYIQTVPRVGYRFVADVRETREETPPLVITTHTLSKTVVEEEILTEESTSLVVSADTLPKSIVSSLIRRRSVQALTVAFTLALGFGGAYYLRNDNRMTAAENPTLSINSIAVLPPQPLNPEAENSALRLGIADALITRLSVLRKVTVRPTSAIARYVGDYDNPVSVGRSLRVDAVLEGSLQRVDGRVRVSLRLLDTKNEMHLWTGKFEEADGNIFKLQDSIAEQVARALSLDLTSDEKGLLTKRQTSNPDAYSSYLKGNYFWSKRGFATEKAYEHFRKAIELDPNFAEAYAGLANLYATQAKWAEAEMFAQKALELDESLAELHATSAFIKMFRYWDWEGAETALDRAIELNPDSANAHHWKGVYFSLRGRLSEAKAAMHRALQLDPLSLIITADIGQLHYFSHEYDAAIEYCNRALALDSTFEIPRHYLVQIYRTKGMYQESFNERLHLLEQHNTPGTKEFVLKLQRTFSRSGMQGLLKFDLKNNLTASLNRQTPALELAEIYLELGYPEEALNWLEKSYEQREFMLAFIKVHPFYDPLRNDPRFQGIVARMGL